MRMHKTYHDRYHEPEHMFKEIAQFVRGEELSDELVVVLTDHLEICDLCREIYEWQLMLTASEAEERTVCFKVSDERRVKTSIVIKTYLAERIQKAHGVYLDPETFEQVLHYAYQVKDGKTIRLIQTLNGTWHIRIDGPKPDKVITRQTNEPVEVTAVSYGWSAPFDLKEEQEWVWEGSEPIYINSIPE